MISGRVKLREQREAYHSGICRVRRQQENKITMRNSQQFFLTESHHEGQEGNLSKMNPRSLTCTCMDGSIIYSKEALKEI